MPHIGRGSAAEGGRIRVHLSVPVRDGQLFSMVQCDDLGAVGREYNHFFDACVGDTIRRRAEGFDRKHHAGLKLSRRKRFSIALRLNPVLKKNFAVFPVFGLQPSPHISPTKGSN
jgi:hypothetical protein